MPRKRARRSKGPIAAANSWIDTMITLSLGLWRVNRGRAPWHAAKRQR